MSNLCVRPLAARAPQRANGQMLVAFVIFLAVLVAMVGLILDGGSAFAQRRDEQSAADLAALAGANHYLVSANGAGAIAEARLIATRNGYTNGIAGALVGATYVASPFSLTVTIEAPHPNGFASLAGQPSWQVSVSASASGGVPDTATDPAPFVFSADAFNADGTPKAAYTLAGCGSGGCAWPETGDLYPSGTNFTWTDYMGTTSVSSSIINGLIDGSYGLVKTLAIGQTVSQGNSGNHTTAFSAIAADMVGRTYPVAVTSLGANRFLGWANFRVTGASGGSAKRITGYFLTTVNATNLSTSGTCLPTTCPRALGSYLFGLTN
jgi:Flp pilus assembly protein TadG